MDTKTKEVIFKDVFMQQYYNDLIKEGWIKKEAVSLTVSRFNLFDNNDILD